MKEMINSAIESLKAHPMVLALLLFNLIVLGAIYMGAKEGRAQLAAQMTLVL